MSETDRNPAGSLARLLRAAFNRDESDIDHLAQVALSERSGAHAQSVGLMIYEVFRSSHTIKRSTWHSVAELIAPVLAGKSMSVKNVVHGFGVLKAALETISGLDPRVLRVAEAVSGLQFYEWEIERVRYGTSSSKDLDQPTTVLAALKTDLKIYGRYADDLGVLEAGWPGLEYRPDSPPPKYTSPGEPGQQGGASLKIPAFPSSESLTFSLVRCGDAWSHFASDTSSGQWSLSKFCDLAGFRFHNSDHLLKTLQRIGETLGNADTLIGWMTFPQFDTASV